MGMGEGRMDKGQLIVDNGIEKDFDREICEPCEMEKGIDARP
jgi:hypothetical protein